MDTRLLTISFMLLALELSILLGDLGFLPLKLFPEKNIQSHERLEVGRLVSFNNHVKRKFEHSFIWEESHKEEELFSYDSILTLANSTAEIALDGDINIKLYENTLIVIEPPEQKKSDNSIHLKFAKGDLRSILKEKTLELSSKNWKFSAKSGSDISFRSMPGEQLEIEVSKGELELTNKKDPKKNLKVKQGKSLELSKKGIEKSFDKSKDLKWSKQFKPRLYTQDSYARAKLQWEGYADSLEIIFPDKTRKNFSVNVNQRALELKLEKGQHFVRLKSGKKISDSFPLEVLPTPDIRYFYPFPRNRILSDQNNTFSWSRLKGVKHYRLELSREKSFLEIHEDYISQNSFLHTDIQNRGPLYWRVIAIDDQGIEIPSRENRLMYSISDALAAPVLKEIKKERVPASKKEKKNKQKNKKRKESESESIDLQGLFHHGLKFLWSKIDTAYARDAEDQKYQYQFYWEKVSGADFYIIEISEKDDFYKLLDSDKIDKEKYIWESSYTGKVYWRVAGGANDGKMGLFSKPQKVDLASIKLLPKSKKKVVKKAPKVKKNKMATKKKPLPKVVTEVAEENIIEIKFNAGKELPEKEFPPEKTTTLSIPNKKTISLMWDLGYAKQKGRLWQETAGYTLVGIIPLSMEFSLLQYKEGDKNFSYQLILNWDRSEWKAKNSKDFSFQEKVVSNDYSLKYYFKANDAQKYRWGIYTRNRAVAIRRGNESLSFANKNLVGLSYWKAIEQEIDYVDKAEMFLDFGIGNGLSELAGGLQSLWKMKSAPSYRMNFTTSFQFYAHRNEESAKFSNHMELMFGLKIDWDILETNKPPN